jgi:predicted alpha/beta superfamily hydrolase
MLKPLLTLFSFFCLAQVNAQFTVRLLVNEVATKPNDDIYLAGTMNNWNPRNPGSKLKLFGPKRRGIVLYEVAAGYYEFKFTRGSFDKVEVTASGEDIPNRTMRINADTTIEITVAGWKDDYPEKPRPNTATAQVRVMDSAFAMPQLGRNRRIWLYLPKGYNPKDKKKKYPVLYMHDGQNLFTERTAPFGEWGVDECLDSMKLKCIVVGIDHGGDKRLTEYNPFDNEKFGKGEGNEYVDFLVKRLKPYIDSNYNTKKDRFNTHIAGSSMGGLISLYAAAKYPGVFGTAGVFSPAFWVAGEPIYQFVQANVKKINTNLYFYTGAKEGDQFVKDMERMIGLIDKNAPCSWQSYINKLGEHKEAYWRKEFDDYYRWAIK